mmetsp:Transcript_17607/g.54758  ORF Transcript_17607/g.54758 Transcript_17607/m.54758 type:complete len:286 (-) Transcript_17607:1025-1882(-)
MVRCSVQDDDEIDLKLRALREAATRAHEALRAALDSARASGAAESEIWHLHERIAQQQRDVEVETERLVERLVHRTHIGLAGVHQRIDRKQAATRAAEDVAARLVRSRPGGGDRRRTRARRRVQYEPQRGARGAARRRAWRDPAEHGARRRARCADRRVSAYGGAGITAAGGARRAWRAQQASGASGEEGAAARSAKPSAGSQAPTPLLGAESARHTPRALALGYVLAIAAVAAVTLLLRRLLQQRTRGAMGPCARAVEKLGGARCGSGELSDAMLGGEATQPPA